MSRPIVKEIFLIRSIACLCVVLIHSLSNSIWIFTEESDQLRTNLELFQTLLMFATPLFIFISEFVLSYNYKAKLPNGFFTKRVKFILVPFILMGIFYSFISEYANGINKITLQALENIFLGGYHGYFILIIFQFYFLHMIFGKIEKRFSPKAIIITSIIINVAYLSFFNFTQPINIPYADYIWHRLSWLPFLGWISYFVIGYYAGVHYEKFKIYVSEKYKYFVALFILTGIISVVFTYYNVMPEITSKRIDILFYTLSIIVVIFYISLKVKRIPRSLILINDYAFAIYLIHPFSQAIATKTLQYFGITKIPIVIVSYFIVGVILSIALAYIANKIKFGFYFVGKVKTSTLSKRLNSKEKLKKAN